MISHRLKSTPVIFFLIFALLTPVWAGQGQKREPLSDKENPEMIGKRDINKRSLNFYSLEKEAAIGRQISAELDRQLKFVEDPVITEYINRVGQNIVTHSDAKVPFTIKVVDTDEVNAFALPGGYFYVNKGLVLTADNESEIAGVMAHEIAHVAARHGVEQASKGQLISFASIPLIFLGGVGGILARSGANILIPMGFLSFSRGAETEADMLGAQYSWASGYDPNGLISFFEKLQAKETKKPGTISKLFRTHPPNAERIEKVKDLIARFPEREEYTINTSEFNRVKSRLIAVTNTRRIDARTGDTGPKRPTLKRRNPQDDPNADPQQDEQQQPPAQKPTLKRRDGGNTDEQQQTQEQKQQPTQDQKQPQDPNRPVLKRKEGNTPDKP